MVRELIKWKSIEEFTKIVLQLDRGENIIMKKQFKNAEDQLDVSNIYLVEEPQRKHWGSGINFSKTKDIQESSA